MIYLDNASTSYVYPECIEAVNEVLTTQWGNPSNHYKFGENAKQIILEAKKKIAKAIGCDPDEIYFTSGSSEGNAWACSQRERFICSQYEHHNYLENCNGMTVGEDYLIPLSTLDKVTADNLKASYYNCVYAHMLVSNETGEVFDVNKQFKIAHEYGMFVVCDATQALGNMLFNVREIDCDMMVFSGHKIHAPKGIGFCYIKKGSKIKPLIYGTQQDGIRGGTENTPYIKALGIAVEKAVGETLRKIAKSKMFKDIIIDELNKNNISYIINRGKNNIDTTLNISLKGVESEVLRMMLSDKDIYIGTGSGCTNGLHENNKTLEKMGVSEDYIRGPIRFSFSLENTEEEIEIAIKEIIKCYNDLTR